MSTAPTVRFGGLEQRGILLGLTAPQLAVAGTGVAIAVAAEYVAGAAGLAVAAPLWVSLLVLGLARVAGRPALSWLPLLGDWATRRLAGATRYRRHPLTRHRELVLNLPSVPGSFPVTIEATTGAAIVWDRKDSTATAILRVAGPGFLLANPETQTIHVTGWSRFLSSLGQRHDVTRVQIIAATTPPTASRARRWWAEHGLHDTTAAARIVADLLADAEVSTTEASCLVAVAARANVRAPGATVTSSTLTAVAAAIADAGVAVDGWVTPDQLRQLVRRSYDPATALPDPTEDERPVMVGPMGMRESWSHLQTDTAFHVTYWVAQWPRTDVPASFLQPLILSPGSHRSFSLLLEPSSHETAMRRVRRAKVELAADAAQRARLGRLDDASSRAESDEVARREQQLVAGHGDVAFVGLVTVTAATLDGLTSARRATEADAARAGCELRLLVGQQALAHAAATLPLARRLT